MDGTPGSLVGARHPDPSLTRFSDFKILIVFSYEKPVLRWPVLGTKGVGTRHRSLEVNCQVLVPYY